MLNLLVHHATSWLSNVNELYSSPDIVWVIKPKRIRWAGYAVLMGERNIQGFVGQI